MMDSLIAVFVETTGVLKEQLSHSTLDTCSENEDIQGRFQSACTPLTSESQPPSLTNKLSRLTLATFDDEGKQ